MSKSVDPQIELDELLNGADESLVGIMDAYEPLEAVYRNAYALPDVSPEAANTTGLPLAYVGNSSSAR
jgi:hypothetical protein